MQHLYLVWTYKLILKGIFSYKWTQRVNATLLYVVAVFETSFSGNSNQASSTSITIMLLKPLSCRLWSKTQTSAATEQTEANNALCINQSWTAALAEQNTQQCSCEGNHHWSISSWRSVLPLGRTTRVKDWKNLNSHCIASVQRESSLHWQDFGIMFSNIYFTKEACWRLGFVFVQ